MRTCFVICPLGEPNSEQRKRSDLLLKHVITPVITEQGYEIHRADLTSLHDPSVTLDSNISTLLFHADLVVADLSDLNPNVLFELGKRHAWGKPCIHLTCDDYAHLPFDIRNYNIIQYDLTNLDRVEKVRQQLIREVLAWQQRPAQAPAMLQPDDVIHLTRSTVVLEVVQGRRDHYYIAMELAAQPCKAMFLMQRSSSLVLGPEQGWSAEQSFYDMLFQRIAKEPIEFYHIVSLEGIARHTARATSIFPETSVALQHLIHSKSHGNDIVAIQNPLGIWQFKRILEETPDPDMKPDRQARTFMIQTLDGTVDGVIVIDLGGVQVSFHMRGPGMDDFYQTCMQFYREGCAPLLWNELAQILPDAVTI